MNDNLIDKTHSDSNFNIQYCATTKHEHNQIFQDNDSDSSILNLLDVDISEKTPEETAPAYYSMTEPVNPNDSMCHSKRVAIPDMRSETTDKGFEDLLLTKLPQIIAVEKASIQYQVHDQNYPCLSKSFKQCFNSPVLDLLVVVLNTENLVSFYQGYFAGIPRLANELIDLNRKYWKSLISNNDEIAWENHSKSVADKFNSMDAGEVEFELGPVIRCRLKGSTKQQFNQQYNYFFVQPCSYMVQLPQSNRPCQVFGVNDTDNNTDIYMVSYINIVRECDTEYALKGAAAASLQKVITQSSNVQRSKSDTMSDSSINKFNNNRSRRIPNASTGQLSINISSPSYINSEKPMISAPLTYPPINDQQYSKQRTQIQQHINQQQRQSIPMINQYMAHGLSINIIDQNQHHYQGHYQVPQSTSTLQYILENRIPQYPAAKQIHNTPLQMVPQHNQSFQNTGRNSLPCYLPTDHNQSTSSNCSLNSPTTFIPSRHLVPMAPSNGILLSSDQYFRNSHQINVIDSAQIVQPMMTVVRSMPSTPNHSANNYFCSTAQSQLPQTPIHVINSMPHQTQFSSSNLVPYGTNNNDLLHLTTQSYNVNRITNSTSIKQETEDNNNLSQKDWPSNQIMSDSIATTYCGSLTSLPMTSDFEIVEEILKAEEAKSENKQNTMARSISDNSDPLSFDLDDFVLLDQSNRQPPVSNGNMSRMNSSSSPFEARQDEKYLDRQYTKQSSNSSDSLLNLKSETLDKFTNAQKIGIRNFVNQHQAGKLTRDQMLRQINDFIRHTMGKNNHYRSIVEFWKTQHPSVDSSLSNLNCSHVVQSPEEGPGISPTEQAAQSTTDPEEDINRQMPKRSKDDSMSEMCRQRNISRSTTKSSDPSVYRITSTTSTGVLETLLNEHDNPINSEKSYGGNFGSKLSISSTPKHQLSLDQLLMDDECSMLSGFQPTSQDDKSFKKSSDLPMRQLSSNNKSQPTTPYSGGNMGVLESLLNQKNPMYGIRQKSTESILKHSKPSRQNSVETFQEDSLNAGDNATKKNSLLITLLNNSTGNTSSDKYSTVNSSTPSSIDATYLCSQPKRQRMFSGANIPSSENSYRKKLGDKLSSSGMDVFDFVDYEHSHTTTEFQSGTVTSSQSINPPKTPQGKRNRKRCYSKEMSIDSDCSSEKTPSSVCNSISSDKKVILTSMLETRKHEDTIMSTAPTVHSLAIDGNDGNNFLQSENRNTVTYDDNIDLEDIKIDDFDLEHLIDMSEQLDQPAVNDNKGEGSDIRMGHETGVYGGSYSTSSYDISNTPIYTTVTPVINISQSDPIVPVSKQSIIRLSDKNSILFSAIQSTSSMNTITVECLDNERERLLKQQQQQKVCMGGKYVSLNQLGNSDVDSQQSKVNHPLSLDLLSKQLKEVGPNVMVEPSNNIECFRPRKSSCSKIPPAMSPSINQSVMPSSPLARSSSSSEMQSDNSKISTASSSNVNHQQVREGLRLLVSNRSAQNSSKINSLSQRPTPTGFSEMTSPNSEYNNLRASSTKSMIHYHSDSQVTNNQKSDPTTVSYPVSILHSNVVPISETKATNILEDSLVNDVFELEELVNSKTSKPTHENDGYPSKSSSELPSSNGDTQLMTASSNMNSPSINLQSNLRQPHHHHHLQHFHHHHPHHHHHPAPTSLLNNETTNAIAKNKQSANTNSGLLETLLSK